MKIYYSLFTILCLLNLVNAKCDNIIENPLLQQSKSFLKRTVNTHCTCGVFLEGQLMASKEVFPGEKPAFMKEMDVPIYPCGVYGSKQCMKKCMTMVLNYLPSIGPLVCASIGRNCAGEKARLFTKNCGGDWQDTGFSAGKHFCCKNGMEVNCENDLLNKDVGLLDMFDSLINGKSFPEIILDMADRTTNFATNILRMTQ